jgi:hypothetical protein
MTDRGRPARAQELLQALNRLAKEINVQEVGWAEKVRRKIKRALQFAKDNELRNRRYDEFISPRKKQRPLPNIKWATHLVSVKLNKKRWGRGKKPSNQALCKIKMRAAHILSGAKAKSRKNFTEDEAARLANETREEWFSSKGELGRPTGKRTDGGTDHKWLSVEQIVAVILRTIEESANTKLKVVISDSELIFEIQSPTFAALVAAVRTERPGISLETAARMVARVRSESRQSTIRVTVSER